MNRVTGPYQAEINGKRAALAGCDQAECERRAYCLRADRALESRAKWKKPGSSCPAFIPLEEAANA